MEKFEIDEFQERLIKFQEGVHDFIVNIKG